MASPPDGTHFDAIVIGGGIAGTLTAIQLGRGGFRVLLCEASSLPRHKVCGCCLNRRGQNVLVRLGLVSQIEGLGGRSIDRLQLRYGRQSVLVPIARMLTTSRYRLDEQLCRLAAAAGVVVHTRCEAKVIPERSSDNTADQRHVELISGEPGERSRHHVTAAVVIAADGLRSSSLSLLPEFRPRITEAARIGCAAVVDVSRLGDWAAEPMLRMTIDRQLYVGTVPVEGSLVDLAAAVDPQAFRGASELNRVVCGALERTGLSVAAMSDVRLAATPRLTRSLGRVAARRLLVVGDATGYVEPFTGEGMSWAAAAAEIAAPLAAEAIEGWSDGIALRYSHLHKRFINRKKFVCRSTMHLLRRPRLVRLGMRLASAVPLLPARIAAAAGS